MSSASARRTVPGLAAMARAGEKIAMLTCYDASFATMLDRAGVDTLLIGDSLGIVIGGHSSTLPVTLDEMIYHTRCVAAGARSALIIADMSFGSYQASREQAYASGARLMAAGAQMVKVEGGAWLAPTVEFLVARGIPVCGHLGLQPQSVHQTGGYVKQATEDGSADALLADAIALEDAGAFAILLESIPADVARRVTAHLEVPTIGIGAGPECDGQVLVSYDMLGLFDGAVPSFVKQYARLSEEISAATREYVEEVRSGRYPLMPAPPRGIPTR